MRGITPGAGLRPQVGSGLVSCTICEQTGAPLPISSPVSPRLAGACLFCLRMAQRMLLPARARVCAHRAAIKHYERSRTLCLVLASWGLAGRRLNLCLVKHRRGRCWFKALWVRSCRLRVTDGSGSSLCWGMLGCAWFAVCVTYKHAVFQGTAGNQCWSI